VFRPKIPTNPTPTGAVIPLPVEPTAVVQHPQHTPVPTPVPAAPMSSRPTVQLTPGALLAVVGGATAGVLVVGAVLVSMLLAVAITAVSVTVCVVVLRLLMKDLHKY
jgi:hypothetical protein